MIGAGSAGEAQDVLAQRFIDRVRELNRGVGIPEKIAALKAADVPTVARAAMIEAARDYPVPMNMSLGEAQALLQRMQATGETRRGDRRGQCGRAEAVFAQRFIDRVRELNLGVGIPEKVAALKASDVPTVARAAMIEAARDYPVPMNMSLGQAQVLLQRMQA